SKGQSVRIRVSEVRETGRNAQGVKLMNLGKNEFVQDVATVIADEENNDPEPSVEPSPA
ncbi:MAG: DNA gyrase C-terminal beta-propeller domain-containing protein, partial [Verrucomicrobiaceae bacterium]